MHQIKLIRRHVRRGGGGNSALEAAVDDLCPLDGVDIVVGIDALHKAREDGYTIVRKKKTAQE